MRNILSLLLEPHAIKIKEWDKPTLSLARSQRSYVLGDDQQPVYASGVSVVKPQNPDSAELPGFWWLFAVARCYYSQDEP
ncbi:MAG: hypothetical protein O2901_04305 [Verrucomicrobia bacterium]|nr:hypothetical protein [Verrucomicrobiota bacterium]